MNSAPAHPNYVILSVIATPILALAAYVAWQAVPVVVERLVPAVVRAVAG